MWRLPPTLFLFAGAAAFSPVPVFESYSGIPLANCFRQPILLRITSTTPPTLLAIAEGRTLPVNWCSSTEYPDTPDFLIAARRSTDEGATWGELINITHGNLDFLTALYDESGGGVVHLMLQQGDAGVVETTSSDGGLTWTPTANVSIDGADAFATVIPGVGHGLEIRNEFCWVESCGATVGRLVMPFVCTLKGPVSNDTACSNCRTCLVISDNHGATWRVGAVSDQEGTREAALVQGDTAVFNSPEAVIFAQERNLGPTPGTRLQAFSLNSGSGFQYLMNTSLPDVVTGNWTGVVSGTARFDERNNQFFVFTAPAEPGVRAKLSAFVSEDEGASWGSKAILLYDGPSAYSDLIMYNSTHLALLWENGDAGSGDFAARISFSFISKADLGLPPQRSRA